MAGKLPQNGAMRDPTGGSGPGFFIRFWSCCPASFMASEVHCCRKSSLAIRAIRVDYGNLSVKRHPRYWWNRAWRKAEHNRARRKAERVTPRALIDVDEKVIMGIAGLCIGRRRCSSVDEIMFSRLSRTRNSATLNL